MSSETFDQYIFLGIQQDTFFFQHLVRSQINLDMSSQIMNLLINENRITKEQSVIIYEINDVTEIADVVYIRHENSSSKSFNKENLVEQYKRLITTPREDSFIISTDGNRYESGELPISFICEDIDFEGFSINEIHEFITAKKFKRSIADIQKDYDNFQRTWNKIKNNKSHHSNEECSKFFIATFKVYEKDGEIITISSLSQDVNTYLPKTNVISLFDNNGILRMFTFDSFLKVMNLKPVQIKDKKDIIYYICYDFPTEEQISIMDPYISA